MIDIRVVDGLYVLTACKCTVVLTKREFIQALHRGKWWRRQQVLQGRLAHGSPNLNDNPPTERVRP